MWFDAGVNLTNKRLLSDLDGVMARAEQDNVKKQLIISTSIEEAEQAVKLCQQFPEKLLMTVGIHPHDAGEAPANYKEQLRELAGLPYVVAIGECGLDFNRNFSPRDVQEEVFVAQIELANELSLPLYLHERDAIDLQIELLNQYCNDSTPCLTHCFTGGVEALNRYAERGHWFGITGWVCDERRGYSLHPLLKKIPANRLMLETDAPYLMPRNISPKPKSRRNEPANLLYVLQMVADCLEMDMNSLAKQTSSTARDFFAL
ncbi:TatD family hydrolase [Idiomarina sp. UBA3992]|uniref:TatD family hydrolase n=1 Tax=Idiomarina sp. UBA3992 TaxID=1946643 RepID=UPI0025794F3E|nr:TatD family hydrolase [Idiomarina sp. UBA3992]